MITGQTEDGQTMTIRVTDYYVFQVLAPEWDYVIGKITKAYHDGAGKDADPMAALATLDNGTPTIYLSRKHFNAAEIATKLGTTTDAVINAKVIRLSPLKDAIHPNPPKSTVNYHGEA